MRVIVTLESRDAEALAHARDELKSSLEVVDLPDPENP